MGPFNNYVTLKVVLCNTLNILNMLLLFTIFPLRKFFAHSEKFKKNIQQNEQKEEKGRKRENKKFVIF